MTGADWLACTNLRKMVDFVRDRSSARKHYLVKVAFVDSTRDRMKAIHAARLAECSGNWVEHTYDRINSDFHARNLRILRDLLGNHFRPVTLDCTWLAKNEGAVPRLALAIYSERAFDQMPKLADALTEAGCTNEDMLSHCRSGTGHVRGCWVVDLLLGKQ